MKSDVQTDEQRLRPLAGARAWLISSGMAGMDVQTRGVAEALGLDYEMKRVDPKGFWRFAAAWGRVLASPGPRPPKGHRRGKPRAWRQAVRDAGFAPFSTKGHEIHDPLF